MMKLRDHLNEERILLHLGATDKDGAIAETAQCLRDHPDVADFDEFVRAVRTREHEGTTGIDSGVAIPHARTDSVRGFVAALSRSREGLDFAAVDGGPVKLVILMGIPTDQVKAYLRLLAHLSLLLKQPEFLKRVLEAESARDVIDVLAGYEA